MINIKNFIVVQLFTLYLSPYAVAMNYDHAYIENFAKSYLEEHLDNPTQGTLEIVVAKIDPRIRIKSCETNLTANIPEKHNSRNVNIEISCEDSTPWQMYLPVKIKTIVPILVANVDISKGSTLDDDNLIIVYKDQSYIRGEYIDNSVGIKGAKAKRNISKNTAITKRNTCVVCKGENITIVAQTANFMIKTVGIALGNGSIGEQVRVKNTQSGRTISARVNAINKVVIVL